MSFYKNPRLGLHWQRTLICINLKISTTLPSHTDLIQTSSGIMGRLLTYKLMRLLHHHHHPSGDNLMMTFLVFFTHFFNYIIHLNYLDEEILKIFKNKSKEIAWFVSNCYTSSKRKELAKKIDEKMHVDIYGKCGKLQCPVDSEECYDLLQSDYKFYLSFENAICDQYITEKLFRPLSRYIIPIVFNGGNTSLYAPPKSFIDANTFKNVDELVKYLNFLNDNPGEYIKYFWWKKYYRIKQHPTYAYMLCDACKKLNDPSFMSKNHQYDDIHAWWHDKQCNKKSLIKF